MNPSEFEMRVRSSVYRASDAVAVLPTVAPPQPPQPADFLAAYFARLGEPIPAMTDGVREGFLHAGSQVQMLFVAINHTQWCLFVDWVNREFSPQIIASSSIRAFTDRVTSANEPLRQRIRRTDYLVLVSTPYGEKNAVKSHVSDIWRVNVNVLNHQPSPTSSPQPMKFNLQTPDRFKNLPPRPQPFTPTNRKD